MSNIGEFELIGRIAAACQPGQADLTRHLERTSCHPDATRCHPELSRCHLDVPPCHPDAPSCHRDAPSCHPERSEGSASEGSASEKSGMVGIGDDCAVIPQRDGVDTLVTTDLLIEDRHFLLSDITPYELGWKSAAVNISDIAAMGGKPVASFLSIALPKNLRLPSGKSALNLDDGEENGLSSGESALNLDDGEEKGLSSGESALNLDDGEEKGLPSGETASNTDGVAEWVDEFIAGFNDLSSRFGVRLLGGDTSASPDKLFINVTVLGECPHGQAVMRSGARPGDLVCVTGPLGDSAAGLKLVLERAANTKVSAGVQNDVPLRANIAQNDRRGPAVGTPANASTDVAPGTPANASTDVASDTLAAASADPSVILSEAKNLDPSASLRMTSNTYEETLISRHYLPMPRVEMGRWLAALPGVHAMMDISDGIASDLRHILKASGRARACISDEVSRCSSSPVSLMVQPEAPLAAKKAENVANGPTRSTINSTVGVENAAEDRSPEPLSAEIDLNALPLSAEIDIRNLPLSAEIDLKSLPLSEELRAVCAERGWDPVELAVSGGEDYELLFTAAPGTPLPDGCTVIGRIKDSRSAPGMTSSEPGQIRWLGSDKKYKGFTHF